MTTTTRARVYNVALAALFVFNVYAAFLVADNPFSAAAFIVSGILCLAVLVSTTLLKRNPKLWGPRIWPIGLKVVYAAVYVVAVLFVLGLFA